MLTTRRATVLLLVLSLLAVIPATPALGLSPTACRVKNTDSGTWYRNFQRAVNKAQKGDRLMVRGICRSDGTTIHEGLKITGFRPKGAARPTLTGRHRSAVLNVADGSIVVIRRLTITNGYRGIHNMGRLILHNVRVTGNEARTGGGVQNGDSNKVSGLPPAQLILTGSTRISGNTADVGGGVYNCCQPACDWAWPCSRPRRWGETHMYGSSRISGNTARENGGGVYTWTTLTLNGSSRISGNTAGEEGGGAWLACPGYYDWCASGLELADESEITANTAPDGAGGGVHNDLGQGVLDPNDCGTRIHDNIGGDCN